MLIKAEAALRKQTTSGICARMIILLTMKRGRVTGMIVKGRLALEAARKRLNSKSTGQKCAAAERYRSVTAEIYRRRRRRLTNGCRTPLEKYAARREELNKALKDGKIPQADYNTLMAAAKRTMKRH
ncbi:hypothetical protein [Escherichia coli]|uniref:hypothetical protein n=1 Tax=Escherichia coli TaxID=562 RepID=UPI00388CFB20